MNWNPITSIDQLEQIKQQSFQTPQVIFKHSTRCSISSIVLNRLERSSAPEQVQFHYLDLLAYRPISDQIAADGRRRGGAPGFQDGREADAAHGHQVCAASQADH